MSYLDELYSLEWVQTQRDYEPADVLAAQIMGMAMDDWLEQFRNEQTCGPTGPR